MAQSVRLALDGPGIAMTLQDWLDHMQGLHPVAVELGLERVRTVARRMALPRPARQVVVVGGTNGKGSTVAFIESLAAAAGMDVGCYTSPHLLHYNERVRVRGVGAPDAALVAAFERVEAARGDTTLTYFEFGTLAALAVLGGADLDLAVLEVGLGGRLDAVNLVDADVAVVTTVALDHHEELGKDRERIAVEKAGIFRADRPAVIGEADPPDALLREARRIGAIACRAGRTFRHAPLPGGRWLYQDGIGGEGAIRLDLPRPPLEAPCQAANAATALAALRSLPEPPALDADTVSRGLMATRLPGRLQRLPGPVELIVDVAHNPQAAQQLAHWLIRNRGMGSTQAVFSALGDKDIPNLVAPLLTCVDAWRLAGLADRSPRGLEVEALWRPISGLLSRTLATRHPTVDDALEAARRHAQPGDRIVVFGSFLTAAAALASA